MSRIGLVLEGGSMRGLFTAGILDVLMEHSVRFDGVIGVSAGACFGCNLKSHQPGRAVRYNVRFCRDPRYSGWQSFLRTGDVYGAEFCYKTIPQELDPFDVATFAEDPTRFEVVCTDVSTGQPVYHELKTGNDEDLLWMRASASMPLVSRVVQVGGYGLLDGGISDSVPLKHFEESGYARNVVILTQPDGYVKQPSKLQIAFRLFLRKYPAIINAMATRHERYNAQRIYITQREQAGAALVIRPDHALDVASIEHDPDKLRAVYTHGRKVGMRELARIQAFIEKN